MASAINNFFINIGGYSDAANSNEAHVANTNIVGPSGSVMLEPISPYKIDNTITNLKNNAAAGEDDIKTVSLKHVSPLISLVLSHIVNQILSTGLLPNKLKIGWVSPVHKGAAGMACKITGQYQCCLSFPKHLKRW